MGKLTTRLITLKETRRHLVDSMYDLSGEQTVILITNWWLHKVGKDCQYANKQHRSLMWKDLMSGN